MKTVQDEISADAKIEPHDEPVYNKNFSRIKTKILCNKDVPKADSYNTCLVVISLDSIFRVY